MPIFHKILINNPSRLTAEKEVLATSWLGLGVKR